MRKPLLFLTTFVLSLGLNASAQISGGVFRGEIRDSTDAVAPGVRIRIQSDDSIRERWALSNGDGIFVSPDLIPGSYTLTAVLSGFRSESIGPVMLRVNQTVRVDFRLFPGNVSESVRVDATAAQLLGSESAEIAQVIDRRQVSGMPLNGRRWQQLITLSAGVNPGSPGESGSPNPVNINGQRTKANLFQVDGIPVTSSAQGRGNNFNIPLEAVREFSVQSGAYSAEYGNVAGGVINLQSKSGSGAWHGSLFEFFRNDKLDAANFFSNATGQPKNALRYHQFGGSLGGPIRRGRTFFFADYQGTLSRNAAPMVTTVRPETERHGDFSKLPVPIFDPFAAPRTPFPGNRIPEARLDRAAFKIASLLPQPNQFDGSGSALPFNNYAVTRSAASGVHSFDVRADHQFSDRNTIFARHSFQDTGAAVPSVFGPPLGGSISGSGDTGSRNQNTAIGHSYQLTPTLVHEVRLGFNRQTIAIRQEDYGRKLSEEFGIPGVNRNDDTSGLSTISVAGVFNVGGSILTPLRLAITNWNWSNRLLWVRGRHTLRAGTDNAYEKGSSGYRVFGRGYYTFLSLTTGDAFASFLTGVPFQVLRDEFPPGLAGLVSRRFGVFVQDDFKVSPRLTLNLGARYDLMPYAHEVHDRLSNFDPATRTMLLAGVNTSRRLRQTDKRNVAPRIGLAYGLGGKSVIRAGYGIGYVDPVGSASVLNSTQFNIPFYFRDNITQFPGTAPRYVLSSTLPALAVPSPTAPTGDQRYLVPGDRNQYSQTWSFAIQHALSASLLIETAYVGTSGTRLLMTSNINAAAPGRTDPVARRPFGLALGEVRAFSNSGHSTYHGLQSRIEQRFSRGLFFLGSYAWSKSIDNQSTGSDDASAGGQSPQDPARHSLDRGLSSFDRTHRAVGSLVWEMPLPGWQLSGIFEVQTGAPFSVLMPCAAIGAEGNNCRPNLLGDPSLAGDARSVNRWFDKTAFAIPSAPGYGNAGRNILRGPGSANLDLAVSKAFRFGPPETGRRLGIRGEFFNALNHTNPGLPAHSIDSAANGTITSAAAARVIQVSARVEF